MKKTFKILLTFAIVAVIGMSSYSADQGDVGNIAKPAVVVPNDPGDVGL